MTCRTSAPVPGFRPRTAILLLLAIVSAAPCPGPPDPAGPAVMMRVCWQTSGLSADDEVVVTVGRISRATNGKKIWAVGVPIGEGRAPATAGEMADWVPWPTTPEPCWNPKTRSIGLCPPSRVLYITDVQVCRANGCCGRSWGDPSDPPPAAAVAP